MYADHSPQPGLVSRVLVIEEDDIDIDPDEIMEMARDEDAVTRDGDRDEIFWIVFDDEPQRVWDFTKHSLLTQLANRRGD